MARHSAPDMCQVFISYSRQDQEFVLRLAEDLRKRDVGLWLDQLDIIPGERWDDQIQTALGACRHLIAILSPTSVESQNFKDEISFAFDEGKTIIPVLYRETVIPFRLRRLQYVDFQANYDKALNDLVELLSSSPASEPTAKTSQLAATTTPTSTRAESIPPQTEQPIPEISATPAPTAAPKVDRGLPKWAIGVGVGAVALVAIVVAMTLTARGRPMAVAQQPSTATPTATAQTPETQQPATAVAPTATATGTATPSPSTPTLTFTPIITPTATPTITPTATPTIIPTVIPPTPTLAPEGLLAYPEYDSTRQTFAIKIYDLAQKQVIDTIDQASQPAISPEGQEIAYRSWNPSALNLLREAIGTSGPPQHVSSLSESNRPQWRWDNQRIIFTRVGFKDIRHVDDTGVRTPGQATTPAWLPDGSLIFNGWFAGNDYGLIVTDEAGGNPDQLTRHPNDLTPAPSPDGQKVAFMSDRDGNWEIYLLDFQSRVPTRLTNHPARDGLPIFSPDGSQVAFVSDRGEQWGIWLLDWQRPGTEKLLLPIPGGLDGTVADVNQELQPHWSLESISWWDK